MAGPLPRRRVGDGLHRPVRLEHPVRRRRDPGRRDPRGGRRVLRAGRLQAAQASTAPRAGTTRELTAPQAARRRAPCAACVSSRCRSSATRSCLRVSTRSTSRPTPGSRSSGHGKPWPSSTPDRPADQPVVSSAGRGRCGADACLPAPTACACSSVRGGRTRSRCGSRRAAARGRRSAAAARRASWPSSRRRRGRRTPPW